MKRRLIFWGSLIGILALLTSYKIFSGKAEVVSVGGPGARGPLRVDAVVIESNVLSETIHSTGSVLANEEVELRSEISARVTSIAFQEGSFVKKGDLLVKLNDADLQAQLNKLEAQRKVAQTNEARQRSLREQDLQSQEIYDAALVALQAIEADIEQVRAVIAKTEIRAPFDGRIGLRYVSEGAYITPSNRIASLQNLNALKIDFSIPEKYASRIRTGAPVRFTVPGSTRPYNARIFAIEPKIDPNTRTLQIRAVSTNHDRNLMPGAFADVAIALRENADAVMIPSSAIVPELKGQRVWLVRGGKAESVPVTTGLRTESRVQITSGLSAGDTLIVTGIMQLRPGNPVDVRITDINAL
jgi:membrane fusion protein (multidrug efflux system)